MDTNYAGPGYYQLMWSDGGDGGFPQWAGDAAEYGEILECASRWETETHLAYAELVGRDVFQMHELEAFLGEPDDFDVDEIIDEATFIDYRTGDRIWLIDINLNEICKKNIKE